MRPYYNVYLLGEQTEGKNVGSVTFTDDKYDYELHPIVCQIFNAKGQSNYAKGFAPDWLWEKNAGLIDGHIELGDKDNDVLLKNALQMMTKGAVTTRSSAESSINAAPQYSSLDYKNNQRLIVPAQ